MLRDALIERLHKGRLVAGERAATSADWSAWVGIYPINPLSPNSRSFLRRHGIRKLSAGQRAYNIRLFEVEKSKMDTWFYDGDLRHLSDNVVVGDDALIAKLAELGIPLESLGDPAFSDYPL